MQTNTLDLNQVGSLGNSPNSNIGALANCSYVGRGLVQGITSRNEIVQVYWLTGRSESSKNRVLEMGLSGMVSTNYANPTQGGGNADLIIYDAVARNHAPRIGRDICVVSNGSQTNRILDKMMGGTSFPAANADEAHEPDPSGTSRITGVTIIGRTSLEMWFGVARKSQFADQTEHVSTCLTERVPGRGHCTVTYANDSPAPDMLIPAYRGSVFPVELVGTPEEIADTFWNALNPDLRVALVVNVITPRSTPMVVLRNLHEMK